MPNGSPSLNKEFTYLRDGCTYVSELFLTFLLFFFLRETSALDFEVQVH